MHFKTFVTILALAATVNAGPTSRRNPLAGSRGSIEKMKHHIKNVVVMVMENRSLDNLLGGQKIRGLDNPINNGPFCNPINITDPSEGQRCTQPSDYNSVPDDPDHSVSGNNMEFYGTFTPDNDLISEGKLTPNMIGIVDQQIRDHGTGANRSVLETQVMNYYTEEQIPVLTALTQNFVVFNRWHGDIPGVSAHTLPLPQTDAID
jgi:phospholipase C